MPAPECITTAFKQVAFHYQTTARYNTTNLRSLLKVVINYNSVNYMEKHPPLLSSASKYSANCNIFINKPSGEYCLYLGSSRVLLPKDPLSSYINKNDKLHTRQLLFFFLQTFANAESRTTHVSLQKNYVSYKTWPLTKKNTL